MSEHKNTDLHSHTLQPHVSNLSCRFVQVVNTLNTGHRWKVEVITIPMYLMNDSSEKYDYGHLCVL